MPKNIDDLLNPPPAPSPEPYDEKILLHLRVAKQAGHALSYNELSSKLMGTISNSAQLAAQVAECMQFTNEALNRLVQDGRVLTKTEGADAFYWLPD